MGDRHEGEQLVSAATTTRWRNEEYDRAWKAAESEMDPVKRAALFIRMNDLLTQNNVDRADHLAELNISAICNKLPEHRHLWLGLELLEPHPLVSRGLAGAGSEGLDAGAPDSEGSSGSDERRGLRP